MLIPLFLSLLPSLPPPSQRPKRATPSQITRFHTDDYVDFLLKVTPETVNELTGHGTRCELQLQPSVGRWEESFETSEEADPLCFHRHGW